MPVPVRHICASQRPAVNLEEPSHVHDRTRTIAVRTGTLIAIRACRLFVLNRSFNPSTFSTYAVSLRTFITSYNKDESFGRALRTRELIVVAMGVCCLHNKPLFLPNDISNIGSCLFTSYLLGSAVTTGYPGGLGVALECCY